MRKKERRGPAIVMLAGDVEASSEGSVALDILEGNGSLPASAGKEQQANQEKTERESAQERKGDFIAKSSRRVPIGRRNLLPLGAGIRRYRPAAAGTVPKTAIPRPFGIRGEMYASLQCPFNCANRSS